MTEYAVLALLLLRATGSYAWAFAAAVAYACTDEFHQTFVRGRHGAPLDVVIDAVGGVAGRELEALLARPVRLADELRRLNAREERREELTVIAHELRSLTESLQALAYAALGTQGPQVRRRRAG